VTDREAAGVGLRVVLILILLVVLAAHVETLHLVHVVRFNPLTFIVGAAPSGHRFACSRRVDCLLLAGVVVVASRLGFFFLFVLRLILGVDNLDVLGVHLHTSRLDFSAESVELTSKIKSERAKANISARQRTEVAGCLRDVHYLAHALRSGVKYDKLEWQPLQQFTTLSILHLLYHLRNGHKHICGRRKVVEAFDERVGIENKAALLRVGDVERDDRVLLHVARLHGAFVAVHVHSGDTLRHDVRDRHVLDFPCERCPRHFR
jgi:hypothetical protein